MKLTTKNWFLTGLAAVAFLVIYLVVVRMDRIQIRVERGQLSALQAGVDLERLLDQIHRNIKDPSMIGLNDQLLPEAEKLQKQFLERITAERTPDRSTPAWSTKAPAPSPKSTHVLRSL